ncbi:uncharacterized protein LOC142786872 isoform X2 [Rhipicephalus microplus]|uniref:uncharacterized protein LOC142786872 isoform X2 n=1 Tax=Rhipicephalus microplus TaxID=6941 RepID=UPI003F6B29FB
MQRHLAQQAQVLSAEHHALHSRKKHWDCVRQVRAIMDLPYVQQYCCCSRSCVDVDHYKELSFAAIPQDFHNNQTTIRKSGIEC